VNAVLKKTLVFLIFSVVCSAADWSSLYDTGKLEAEKPRLQRAIDVVVEKEISPFIPQQEATAFGLQPIELPTDGFRADPLDFYSEKNKIVLPVRTLLFVEDLARAYGWMWANRFTTKTVDEYLSMLRYRPASSFPDGKYPAPLSALHVPDNALADPHVVEASVRLRRTAYSFMLLHQFGHLQMHHEVKPGRPYSEAQEEEADRFALAIMKGNSVTPTGVLLVMYGGLFLESGEAGALHPVTSHRLEAMAHFLDSKVIEFVRGRSDRKSASDGIFQMAKLFSEGAEWLSVPGHQEELQQLALKTDPASLLPRPLPKSTQ
jgi:hypothetical protein